MCDLWIDGKTEEEILSADSHGAVLNLLEDIQCLKENLDKNTDKKALFEKWYTKSCEKIDMSKILEIENGHYKYMQAQNDYTAFCAGVDAAFNT